MRSARGPFRPSRARLPLGSLFLGLPLALGALGACKPPDPPPPSAPAPARQPIDVMAPGGERTLRLEADESGYTLVDAAGWAIGRAFVDKSTVRLTDRQGSTVVTVSRTPEGFLLDDGSGGRLVGTEGDEGLELARDGIRVGLLAHHALALRDRTLFVASNADYVQVVREGTTLLEVRGPVGDAAVYLAWTELRFPERLALMLFSTELL